MGAASTYDVIRARIQSLWAGPEPVLYEEDGQSAPESRTPWVRVTVREGDGNQLELAGELSQKRTQGLIIIECFQGANSGTTIVRRLADRFVPILESRCLEGVGANVLTREAQSAAAGRDNDGWYGWSIRFPYQRDETIRTAS